MYCVNCGVKLADTEKRCPLCGVEAIHPQIRREEGEPMFPGQVYPEPQLPPRTAQIIVTTLFLLPLTITLLCDLRINGSVTWSGYVMGALAIAYSLLVLPSWFSRPSAVLCALADFTVVGLYLLYINHAVNGDWFLTFALPVVAYVGLVTMVVLALLHRMRRRRLWIFGGAFLALGLLMPLLEGLICHTFRRLYAGWSLYPMISLFILGGMLLFLSGNTRARERMERKFFL